MSTQTERGFLTRHRAPVASSSRESVGEKENPTDRNPWGPGEARRTARGGISTKSVQPVLKSSEMPVAPVSSYAVPKTCSVAPILRSRLRVPSDRLAENLPTVHGLSHGRIGRRLRGGEGLKKKTPTGRDPWEGAEAPDG
jgi:hypothetical protein